MDGRICNRDDLWYARPLYETVVFDGNDFISKRDNKELPPVTNSEKEIVLNTKREFITEMKTLTGHLGYFPTYITKYLKIE